MDTPATGGLGDVLEAYVNALIQSGRFGSRSDVLREGVRLVEEREARLALLVPACACRQAHAPRPPRDDALQQGLRDADAGRVNSLEVVTRRLSEKWDTTSTSRRP